MSKATDSHSDGTPLLADIIQKYYLLSSGMGKKAFRRRQRRGSEQNENFIEFIECSQSIMLHCI
jgi:hypothetical protein